MRTAALVGLPAGLIENVTDGRDAHLVAQDASGRILRSEEAIVDARRQNTIKSIFLIDRPLTEEDARALEADSSERAAAALDRRRAPLALNPRLAAKIAAADVIIYAPGTQHSSLFPSYLTPGLSEAIAANLRAIKLLVTNIQTDAEITGSTAVDLIDRALYYLNLKGQTALPTPCLITHYLLNEPGRTERAPYVPLGPIETIEDPRLVRIGAYEDGITGRHDAARILGPYLDALLAPRRHPRLAVLLHDAGSVNKITQTLLEMVRGGVDAQPIEITVFCLAPGALDAAFLDRLPFEARTVSSSAAFLEAVRAGAFDYVGLFESSGMYRGEDLVALASHLTVGRLDAVWGSRRLSVRDIQDSYRLRYEGNALLGAVSYAGQPPPEPRVSAALRPLHLGHIVRSSRRTCERRARGRHRPDPQACQPAPAREPVAPSRRTTRAPGPVRPDLARQGEADQCPRRPPVAVHDPGAATPAGATA